MSFKASFQAGFRAKREARGPAGRAEEAERGEGRVTRGASSRPFSTSVNRAANTAPGNQGALGPFTAAARDQSIVNSSRGGKGVGDLREAAAPVVTFSPSWTLVPTFECFNACTYCSFKTAPRRDDAEWLRPDQVRIMIITRQESGLHQTPSAFAPIRFRSGSGFYQTPSGLRSYWVRLGLRAKAKVRVEVNQTPS